MSRRDTILVAILINAGLLLVLFITAMTTEHEVLNEDHKAAVLAQKEPVQEREGSARSRKSTAGDEVDEVLAKEMQRAVEKPVLLSKRQEKQEVVQTVETKEAQEPVFLEETEEKKYVEVTVKSGDFLEKIAKANATTVDEIMRVNHLSSTRLRIGQILLVPLPSEDEIAQKLADETGEQVRQEAVEYYTVKSGDNPWLIAMKHRMKLEDLLRLNDLNEEKARRLNPGDRIRIR